MGKVSNFEDLGWALGCKVSSLPSSYLAPPLGASFKSLRVWHIVKERFRIWLIMWKRRYLSKGERLTLVKSTPSSLLIYYMSLFVIPHKVSLTLEKIKWDFLWRQGELQSRLDLVKRSLVYMDKKDRDLGIRNLSTLNKTLLGKWCWKFTYENWISLEAGDYRHVWDGKGGVNVLEFWGKVMVWVFGGLLGVGGWSLTKGLNLGWEIVEGWEFGRIGGVMRISEMRLSLNCSQ